MYIIYKNNAFSISSELFDKTVCELLPPVCIENGEETEIPFAEEKDGCRCVCNC